MKHRLGHILVPVLLGGAAHAQVTPPPVDAGKAIQQTRPALPPADKRAPEPIVVQPQDQPLTLPAGQTLTVTAFRFEGSDAIPEVELQGAVNEYKGRALTLAEIEAAAGRITEIYRIRGYLVARAYVPRQDASGGTLTIRVVTGKYGQVNLQNGSLVDALVIAAYFSSLKPGQPVTREELERAMLLVGDLPGATLPKVNIAPGSEPETSDFNVEIPPGPRFNGFVLADNYGSRLTGRNRLSLGASVNSPAGRGDKLDFSGLASNGADLLNGRVAYSIPLGGSGLRGELAIGRTTYELGDIYLPLDAKGTADSVEANFSLPLRRSRTDNLNATLGLVARELRDEINSVSQVTNKKAYAATLGLTQERYGDVGGHDYYFTATGSITWGRLDIDDPAMRAANQAGVNSVGNYGRFNLSVAGRYSLTEALSTSATLSAQRSLNRNLDSSEQLSISGSRGVMAYESAVSGDDGYLLNAELRYALPALGQARQSVSAFLDTGRISLHNGSFTTVDGVRLSDVGLGYSLAWRTWFARAQVARIVGSRPPSVPDYGRTRLLLQLGFVI